MTNENFLEKFEDLMRCAFCLNWRPKNAKELPEGTAYLCDDCNNADRQPKFVHKVDEDNGKVTEVEVTQQEIDQPKPSSDEAAKEIAKAIEEDQEKETD